MTDQVDRALFTAEMTDGVSQPAKSATDALTTLADAADKAGAATETTSQKVTRSTPTLEALANKATGLTAAMRQLRQAQNDLAAAQEAGAAATAKDDNAKTLAAATIDAYTKRLSDAQAKVDAIQAKLSAPAQANSGVVAQLDAIAAAAARMQAVQAQINQVTGVSSASPDAYSQRAADIQAYGNALDALRAKFNPVFAASKQYEQTLNDIAAAQRVGALSAAEAEQAMARATQTFSNANQPLQQTASGLGSLGEMSKSGSLAMRQLGIQGVQTFSSLQAGLPVGMVLVQQGHQMVDVLLAQGNAMETLRGIAGRAWAAMTSPVGLAITAVTAFAAAMAYASVTAETHDRALNKLSAQLSYTRNDYAALAQEATNAAKAMAAATPGVASADASQAARILASSPNFGGTQAQLQSLLNLSHELSTVLGVSMPDAAQKLADAMRNPSQAAQQAADGGLRTMDAQTLLLIEHMENYGDKAGAFQLYTQKVQDAVLAAADKMTPLQQAMDNLSKAFNQTGKDGKSFGEVIGDIINQALANALNNIAGVITKLNDLRTKIRDFLGEDKFNQYFGPNANRGPNANGTLPAPTLEQMGQSNDAAVQTVASALSAASARYGVDPELAARLQQAEGVLKNGQWQTSPTGAIGSMQITQGTFQTIQNLFPEFQGQDINNPVTNTTAGVAYLRHLIDKYGDLKIAILAYHDGEGAVDAILQGKRSESTEGAAEVNKVLANYERNGLGTSNSAYVLPEVTVTAKAPEQYGPALPTGANAQSLANYDVLKSLNLHSQSLDELQGKLAQLKEGMAQLAATGQQGTQLWNLYAEGIEKVNAQITALTPPVQKQLQDMQRQHDMNVDLVKATEQGGAALSDYKAKQAAMAEAFTLSQQTGKSFNDVLNALLPAYKQAAQDAQDLAAASDAKTFQAQIDMGQKELDLIGATTEQRNKELAVMQERQKLGLQLGDQADQEQQKALDAAAKAADAQTHLQLMQSSLSGLQNAVSGAFSTIGNDIAQAFVQGQGAAVNFGNVAKAVLEQVIQYVVQIAVLNPVMNSLFGTNSPTLSSTAQAVGLLGGGSSGLTGSSSSGGGLLGSLSNISTLGSITDKLGLTDIGGQASDFFGNTLGLNDIFGGSGGTGIIDSVLGTPLWGGGGAAISEGGPGLAGSFLAPSSATTIGSLAGGVGLGFGAGSLAGGFIQGALNKTGPGPTIGAGVGAAAGAAIGSIIPGVGTVIGGLLGGIFGGGGGGLFGPHPKNPFTGIDIGVDANGQLAIGTIANQVEDDTQIIAQTQQQIAQINQLLAQNGLSVISPNNPASAGPANRLFTVGDHIDMQGLKSSVAAGFGDLHFQSSDSQLNKALDLHGNSFGSIQDLQNFIGAYQTFVNTTMPQLLQAPAQQTSGLQAQLQQYQQQIDQINQTYGAAIDQAKQYGIATDGLTDAQNKAVHSVVDARQELIDQTNEQVRISRDQLVTAGVAASDPNSKGWADLVNFDDQAGQQRQQFIQQLTTAYGDAYKNTADFASDMALFDKSIQQQRDALQKADELARQQQIDSVNNAQAQINVAGAQARAQTSGSKTDQLNASLYAFDVQAAQQEKSFSQQLIATYGDAYATTADYAAKMADVEKQLADQRLAIQQQYADQAKQAVSGLLQSLTQYAQSLQTSDLSPLSPVSQLNLAQKQFEAAAAAAANGSYTDIGNIQNLASAFLQAERAVNGSGIGYADAYKEVIDTLQRIVAVPADVLTMSAQKALVMTQTDTLMQGIATMTSVLNAIKLQLTQQTNQPQR